MNKNVGSARLRDTLHPCPIYNTYTVKGLIFNYNFKVLCNSVYNNMT